MSFQMRLKREIGTSEVSKVQGEEVVVGWGESKDVEQGFWG